MEDVDESKRVEDALDAGRDVVVDSLPYIDAEDEDLNQQAQDLIKGEMRRMGKKRKDYLQHLPEPDMPFATSHYLQEQFERIRRNRPLHPLDTKRDTPAPPKEDERNELDPWQKSVANARARLEDARQRLGNLELMKRHGGNAWKRHAEELDSVEEWFNRTLKRLRGSIEQVNRKRKTEQENARPTINNLSNQWWDLVRKNNEIETACYMLEHKVKRLKTEARAKGLLPDEEEEDEESKEKADEEGDQEEPAKDEDNAKEAPPKQVSASSEDASASTDAAEEVPPQNADDADEPMGEQQEASPPSAAEPVVDESSQGDVNDSAAAEEPSQTSGGAAAEKMSDEVVGDIKDDEGSASDRESRSGSRSRSRSASGSRSRSRSGSPSGSGSRSGSGSGSESDRGGGSGSDAEAMEDDE